MDPAHIVFCCHSRTASDLVHFKVQNKLKSFIEVKKISLQRSCPFSFQANDCLGH